MRRIKYPQLCAKKPFEVLVYEDGQKVHKEHGDKETVLKNLTKFLKIKG